MAAAAGDRFGPYEIVSLLGVGGMGEVYRARDTRLHREVALKLLPASVAADAERLARFSREARTLATLNHPHIATLYGLEETVDATALVMELVEGETLADALAAGRGLPIPEVVALCRQLIDAIDAAHERGIVHRDLKPANLKITSDRVLKVLDFGLATTPAEGPGVGVSHSPTMMPTVQGMLLGTAPYMSPEQARGRTVDKRTDIWAFGCVVYEMLSGRRAFDGETASDAIAAILQREPDWAALPPATPPSLRRLLQRCLEKDPKRRLRDIGDAHDYLRDDSDAGTIRPETPSSPRARWLPPLAALAAVIAAFGTAWTMASRRTLRPPSSGELAPLTFDGGISDSPTLSPDGRFVAFASDRSGRGDLDIWVQQVPAGTPLRLTNNPADDSMPDFSADGSQIVFRSERNGGGIYVTSALGGGERLIVPEGRSPRFSPDGKRVAYWSGQWRGSQVSLRSSVFVVPLEGGSPSRLLPDFAMARDPVWAPDGRSLLVLGRRDRTSPLDETYDVWWVPQDGRPPVRTGILDQEHLREADVADAPFRIGTWTPAGLVFAIGGRIWRAPIAVETGRLTGPLEQVLFGAGLYGTPTASRDGQIAFASYENERLMQRAPIDRPPDDRPATTLYADSRGGASRPGQTADGATIVFERGAAKYSEIWLEDVRSGEQRMVTRVESASLDPVISPDGSRIVYTTASSAADSDGFVIGSHGGVPKPLCQKCEVRGFLADNRRALAVTTRRTRIAIIDTATGASTDVVVADGDEVTRPHVSPDDRWLSFRLIVKGSAKTYVVHLTPGRVVPRAEWMEVQEPTTTGRPCGWSPDSTVAYLLLDTDGFRCLWGQRVSASGLTGTPFPVRHFHSTQLEEFSTSFGNAVAPSGFLYGFGRLRGTIWHLTPAIQ